MRATTKVPFAQISTKSTVMSDEEELLRHSFGLNHGTPTRDPSSVNPTPVSYTHLRAHETPEHLV